MLQMVNFVVQESSREDVIRNELKELKKQLASLNMADEFAKYAKTERKIIRLKEELKKYSKFDEVCSSIDSIDILYLTVIGLI